MIAIQNDDIMQSNGKAEWSSIWWNNSIEKIKL